MILEEKEVYHVHMRRGGVITAGECERDPSEPSGSVPQTQRRLGEKEPSGPLAGKDVPTTGEGKATS